MTTLPDFRASALLLALGPLLVGATFMWTGALKAIAPHVFRDHLRRLGWIPGNLISYLVPAIAGLETAWGAMLILGVMPAVMLPLTALLLVGFTAVSWWGVKSGRTTDSGCYGVYVVPSIKQSTMLNGAFIALVLIPWIVGPPAGPVAAWKLFAVVISGAAFTVLAGVAQNHLLTTGRFLIKTSPLRVGRRWKKSWGTTEPTSGREMLVSYLGPDCPYCKQWVRVLNAMDQSPDLPGVVGIVAASPEKLEDFVKSSGIRFPVVTIPQTLMSRLVWGVPMTLLVSSGVIETKWKGNMTAEFFERFRKAFFPTVAVAEKETIAKA